MHHLTITARRPIRLPNGERIKQGEQFEVKSSYEKPLKYDKGQRDIVAHLKREDEIDVDPKSLTDYNFTTEKN